MLNNVSRLSFILFDLIVMSKLLFLCRFGIFIKNVVNFKNSSMTTLRSNSNKTIQVNNRQPAATRLLYVGEG